MRSLENIWLLVGIIMVALLVYDLAQSPYKPFSDYLVYIFGIGLSAIMYTFRRTLRLKDEKRRRDNSK